MQIDNRKNEGAMEALYLQRINGLGKCLMLWASLYSEFRAPMAWHYTESAVYYLMLLIGDMTLIASQIDEDLEPFWRQMELVLSRVK